MQSPQHCLAPPPPSHPDRRIAPPRSTRSHRPDRRHETPDATTADQALRDQVLHADYPCVMARAAFNRGGVQVATYGPLGTAESAALLCDDLGAFGQAHPAPVRGPVSFIACFAGPAPADEAAFEAALWGQLQAMHEVDRHRFGWCPEVASAPDDPDFSFSIGGRAYFVIGMHPKASRIARRSAMPVLVFNLHEQFVELRETGKFDGVRDKIQVRDRNLQGSVNPMAADHGERSEAVQYSGRAVGLEWRCPFMPG